MDPIQLGKFIASLRNKKELTQEDLAEMLFIDKRKISRWECGTSVPEFDMLIKLSEILDVSLYELSICKKIENDNLSRKAINKFKSIKDFNKYQTKKKIKTIILFILIITLVITTTYTIKHNGTVEIYQIKSLDDAYYMEGNFFHANDFNFFYLKKAGMTSNNKNNKTVKFDNCEYEFYDKNKRVVYINNEKSYAQRPFLPIAQNSNIKKIVKLRIKCPSENEKVDTYEINVKLIKIYDNKLF